MFFGNIENNSNGGILKALSEIQRFATLADIIKDATKFNAICTDFLVKNNGSAPLIGLAKEIINKIGLESNQEQVEFMLKIVMELSAKTPTDTVYYVKDGMALLCNLTSAHTVTVALAYGEKMMKPGTKDIKGTPISDVEKTSVRNTLRLLRHCPRLRREMIAKWIENKSFDELDKSNTAAGIDLFVALCLGDYTGVPSNDKGKWFESGWKQEECQGPGATNVTNAGSYLGFLHTVTESLNKRYGNGRTAFQDENGGEIGPVRTHKLMTILDGVLQKLYARADIFKETPVLEPKVFAPAQPSVDGVEKRETTPVASAEARDNLRNTERVYRDMTKKTLTDVESFVEHNYTNNDDAYTAFKTVLESMGQQNVLDGINSEELYEFIMFGNVKSIGKSANEGLMVANQLAAAMNLMCL